MDIFILDKTNSVANQFLSELRDIETQKDSMRFRKNLERLGFLLAYEISKELDYKNKTTQTPLGISEIPLIQEQPILLTILRAGLPFYNGFLEVFDKAGSGFIGAYRKPNKDSKDGFDIFLGYSALPSIEGKEIILIDPMLASGASIVKSIKELLKLGTPKKIHLAITLCAPEGIEYLKTNTNTNVKLWTCALDEKLNEHAYIIPGLGDAGDLSFGSKL